MLKAISLISAALCSCLVCFGQPKKTIASKIESTVRMDGSLDDEVWKNASPATGFITNTPSYGKHASDSTVVKVLYNNSDIYISAYLYANPSEIRRQFTPRDQERQSNSDHFAVFIDSYNDRQNAYQFLVTSRNVQIGFKCICEHHSLRWYLWRYQLGRRLGKQGDDASRWMVCGDPDSAVLHPVFKSVKTILGYSVSSIQRSTQ